MLHRKDYEAIAVIVKSSTKTTSDIVTYVSKSQLCHELADYFATDNSQFDRERFLSACGIKSGHNICPFTDDDETVYGVQVIDADRWIEFKSVVPTIAAFADSIYYLSTCSDTKQTFLVAVGADNNIAVVHNVPTFAHALNDASCIDDAAAYHAMTGE